MNTDSVLNWIFENSHNLAWYDEQADEYKRFTQTPIWNDLVFEASYRGVLLELDGEYEREDC